MAKKKKIKRALLIKKKKEKDQEPSSKRGKGYKQMSFTEEGGEKPTKKSKWILNTEKIPRQREKYPINSIFISHILQT